MRNGMSLPCALLAAALALGTSGEARGEMEIWLASAPQCNSCEIFDRAAARRGYGEALRYDDRGTAREIPIRSVAKDALDREILAQIPDDATRGANWALNLTVLVVDEGRLLSFGNIAESADNRELRHADAVMFPPDAPDEDDPSLAEENLYATFFAEHWNLEYFVDVALGRRPPRQPAPLVDLESPRPIALGTANVILWGSAGTPIGNALFISTRIVEIRALLDSLGLGDVRYLTLYGHGPTASGNDTSYIVDGKTRFKHVDLGANLSAGAADLNRVLTGVRRSRANRTLLVQVGHSGPVGSPLWGSGLTLTAEDLAPLRQSDLVMVSGACNGGLFATSVQCGFFAAHPEVVASGCQLSPEALETSDDYLRFFFRAAVGNADSARDENAGTTVRTLAAAHWFATTRLEDHQISYATTDALVDAYFDTHPDRLPPSMTVRTMRQAAGALDADERRALAALTAGLPAALEVPLTGFVELNHAAQAKLENARELSSAERNRLTNMPYKLALPQLARRLVYKRLRVRDDAFDAARACEQQSIPELLSR